MNRPMMTRAYMVKLRVPQDMPEDTVREALQTSVGFGQPEISQLWCLPDLPPCYVSAIGVTVHGPGCTHEPGERLADAEQAPESDSPASG